MLNTVPPCSHAKTLQVRKFMDKADFATVSIDNSRPISINGMKNNIGKTIVLVHLPFHNSIGKCDDNYISDTIN